ncbi:MAG: fibronectin type III domain-containing protein, partial [Rubrobacteraceae bacterium]
TWTAPSDNGAVITSYRITCAPACGSGGTPVTGNPAPTTTAMTGLSNGTSYTFQVRATNSAGEGQPSDSSNAVVPNAPPVAQNQSATLDEDGTKLITLSATDSDNDAIIYRITALPQNGSLFRGDGTAGADRITSAGTNLADNRVTYKPNPDYHGPDSFKFNANDGKTDGNEATVSMTITPVNDAPVLDLNGGASGTGFSATFTEGEGPEPIVAADALTLTDVDDENMASATIRLTNMKDDGSETLSANTSGTAVTKTYDGNTGVLTLTGPASKAAFQQVLRTVLYENTSQNPDTADRIVAFVVNDGEADSNTANSAVSVVSVNDAPTVELEGDDTADEGDVKTYTYTVTDPDDPEPEISESCGENGIKTDTTEPDSFECRFPDGPANSVVSVSADDGEATGGDEIEVHVANVAPSISLSGPATADEGDTKAYAYEVSDPGENDTHVIETSCGENGVKVEGSGAYDPETKEGGFECRFPDGPATTEVAAKVTDSDGGVDSDDQKVVVAVANVAPVVELAGDDAATEGQTKTYTYTVEDPGDPNPEITESCG